MKTIFLLVFISLLNIFSSPLYAEQAPSLIGTPTGTESFVCIQNNSPKTCTISQIGASVIKGAQFSPTGGVGSSTSTFVNGEPSGGTYAINGTTGKGNFPAINLKPGGTPSSPANGDCWTTTAGFYCQINGSSVGPYGIGNGTVSSVGITPPSIFTAGSAVTSSGNLSFSLNSQNSGTVLAAPSGSTGTPTFRALTAADIPTLNQNTTGTAANVTGVVSSYNGGVGNITPPANTFFAGAVSGSGTPGGFRGIVSADLPSSISIAGSLTASTATASKLNLVPGATPSSPSNGDCWTTTAGISCQINGGTVGPFASSVTPQQFLTAGQTAAQLTSQTIDAEPAFAAALGSGSVQVTVPCGNYLFNEPLSITGNLIRISGKQQGCVHIIENFATGSAFYIHSNATYVQIDNIEVSPASGVTRTSGASFHADNAYGILLDHVQSVNDFQGFELLGGTNQFNYVVNNASVIQSTNAAFRFSDDGNTANQVKDVYLNNISVGASAYGFLFQNSSGVYINQADICCGGGNGVLVNPGSGQNVNATYFTKVLSDENTSSNGAWLFNNGGGFVTETYMTDCWGSGSTNGAGLTVNNPNLNGLFVTNFQAHSNSTEGMNLLSGTNIVVKGAQAVYNNTSNTGLPGILIQNAVSHINVSDSTSGKGGYVQMAAPSQANYQSYGIVVGSGATYVDVHDNQTFGNATGGISNTSGSSTNILNNNLSQ